MAEAARVLEFPDDYIAGTAAPAGEAFALPGIGPAAIPLPREEALPAARPSIAIEKAHGVSLFTLFGTVLVAALMVFIVLAYINYTEVTSEIVRLSAQLDRLTEQKSKLEIEYESVIDMKEIERYARDVLGMSKPDANQVTVVQTTTQDKAEIISSGDEANALRGFGTFISSLLDYFRKS